VPGPRADKVAVVEEVQRHFEDADAAILTEYRGLKVSDLATLRRALRGAGAEYKIYKNTLVRRATASTGRSVVDPLLEGPTGIAFVEADVAAVAKVLRDFSRTNPALVVKGSYVGGSLLDATTTASLADLPSREILLAQIAGAFAAPMRQFAGLLKALPQNLAYGISQVIDQKRAEGDTSGTGSESDAGVATAEMAEAVMADPVVGEPEMADPVVAEPDPGATAEMAEADPAVAEPDASQPVDPEAGAAGTES
jgi:large subunit ribosomal protein L10